MFTIRLIQHNKNYKSYSVVSYAVARLEGGTAEIELADKLNGQSAITEYVGDSEQYRIAYVTNGEGKTIDVVKQIEPTN